MAHTEDDPGQRSAAPASMRGEAAPSLLPSVPNFRDLGGVVNAAGRTVRSGQVYRSEVLAAPSAQDLARLAGLGIGAVFDLRNPSERTAAVTAWPRPGDAVLVRPMPDELDVPGADMRAFVQRLRAASLDEGQVIDMLLATYRAMPARFGATLRGLFEILAHGDEAAVLVHCTAGKDRTGFVSAMLLHALDVPVEAVMADYLATARYYTVQRLLAQMEQLSGQALDPRMAASMAQLAQVKAEYLDAAVGEVVRGWGSVSAYLQAQAGLDGALRERLQARLLS